VHHLADVGGKDTKKGEKNKTNAPFFDVGL
jgi:hypothetical protein